MTSIELNCDLGESYGSYKMGNDQAIIPFVDSVNIACGFHAGDYRTMAETVQLAKQHHVQIGAHPGFPDLQGFGRRKMDMNPDDVYDLMLYQIGALNAFAQSQDVKLHHVKPHGALYNMACKQMELAEAIVQAVYDFDKQIILYGLANSYLTRAGEKASLTVAHEVFADRTYQDDGTLTPRSQPNAVVHDSDQALKQVHDMVTKGKVKTASGNIVSLRADTICVHGDTKEAVTFAKRIREMIDTI
ncbi:5-oxoprolinase subunit PxpA [Gracilibacillus sp. YIM 98692]|uniref:5-oxoprolinase subunit PxpA n=1 Tax=Gracilibacillus sp. YIM 98692 TaxID=2663532 RepID=UPI0013D7DF2A|nr:5-oxoprolinase subunit PxpA [Gracilibacillus sp. YIM 98692]